MEIKEELKELSENLLTKLHIQDKQVELLKKKYDNMERQYAILDRRNRKNNIIVFGFSKEETVNDVLATVLTKLSELVLTELRKS